MSQDTLTIQLNGDVSLDDFSTAIRSFKGLVEALSKEIGGKINIEWVIDDLQAGSALAAVRGYAEDPYIVERVVKAYSVVGQSLEHHTQIPYSPKINKHARALTNMLNGRITSIRFETPESDATVISSSLDNLKNISMSYTLGSIKGTVEMLTKRRGLRFTIYDTIFDRAITCYLQKEQEEIMRNAWGKRVMVSGMIGREPIKGFPVVVREITDVHILHDTIPGSYKMARGVLKSTEKAEITIRRLRDAKIA